MAGLMPREHGAYAQLAFPLLTGLILARAAPGAFAFAAVAMAAFFAHEPAAILAGMRGARLHGALAPRARVRLAVLGAIAAAGLAGALVAAPPRAWEAALVPGAFTLPLVPLFVARKLKSLAGELLLAGALASLVLPLARSGPAGWAESVVAAAVWSGAFVPPIVAVHALKLRIRKDTDGRWIFVAAPVVAASVAVAAVVGWAMLPDDPGRDLLAVLPPALATLAVASLSPHPRHLKEVGWTLVASDVLALALLLIL